MEWLGGVAAGRLLALPKVTRAEVSPPRLSPAHLCSCSAAGVILPAAAPAAVIAAGAGGGGGGGAAAAAEFAVSFA